MNELNFAGVYFLLGQDEAGPKIYVGKGDERKNGEGVLARVLRHTKDLLKDDWDEVIICAGANLDSGRISYLEHEFYTKAVAAGRCRLLNKSEPPGRTRDRAVIYGMNYFMQVVDVLLEVLNCTIFVPLAADAATRREAVEVVEAVAAAAPRPLPAEGDEYFLKRTIGKTWKVKARCLEASAREYVVRKGSLIAPLRANRPSLAGEMAAARAQYAAAEQVVALKEDVTFTSLSYAASFVVGNTVNGPTSWKTSNGVTYKERHEQLETQASSAMPVFSFSRVVGKVWKTAARGYELPNGEFVVMKGSRIAPPSMSKPWLSEALRKARVQAKVDEQGLLLQDHTFTSPSTAAGFVAGNNVNGLIEWKNGGKTLKEWRAER